MNLLQKLFTPDTKISCRNKQKNRVHIIYFVQQMQAIINTTTDAHCKRWGKNIKRIQCTKNIGKETANDQVLPRLVRQKSASGSAVGQWCQMPGVLPNCPGVS